jgi:hypothetical protein
MNKEQRVTDLSIWNRTIFPGTGAPPVQGDGAIEDDRFAAGAVRGPR